VRAVIDLHTHSDRSDGSETPGRIVELAHDVGCSAVALTDHDTLDGLAPARARADELGIRLVPGCEVSCLPVAGGGVHVLVYFVDDPASPLGVELGRLRDDRRSRNAALADRLQALGIPVTLEMAAARAGTVEGIGRPHFARAMVDVGAVADLDEAFSRYLGNGGLAYVPKGRLTVADVCRLARDSGGVAVLAHPATMGLEGDALATAVASMAADGLAGLEAVYGRYSPRQRTDLANLARRFGLVATGGSDFHGASKPDLHVGTGTGDLKVPDRTLDRLEAARPGG
jgi:predicted metal-dependent phosphoesterase TrpH